jgi:hypothetical protein
LSRRPPHICDCFQSYGALDAPQPAERHLIATNLYLR